MTVRTPAAARHELAVGAWPGPWAALPSEPAAEQEPSRAPSAAQWAGDLWIMRDQARDALHVLAAALIRDPELSLKFAYAFLMPTLARMAAVLAERAECFGEPGPGRPAGSGDPRATTAPDLRPAAQPAKLRADVSRTLRSLEADCLTLTVKIPFAWDEATRGELLGLAGVAGEAHERVDALAAALPDGGEPASAVPGRPASVTVAPFGLDKHDTGAWEEKTARRLHNFLYEAEMGALELCAENILMAASMPAEFVVDMAIQCFDEARHATALLARFPVYGLRPDSYPASLKLWNRSRELSLAQRLAVHQRIGEWLGVDSLIATSSHFLAVGDVGTARLMQFMARDEIRHVAFGNKWLHWFEEQGHLSVEEIDQWADDYRRSYGDDMGAVGALPLNVRECIDAGFSEHEIERLKRARQGPVVA